MGYEYIRGHFGVGNCPGNGKRFIYMLKGTFKSTVKYQIASRWMYKMCQIIMAAIRPLKTWNKEADRPAGLKSTEFTIKYAFCVFYSAQVQGQVQGPQYSLKWIINSWTVTFTGNECSGESVMEQKKKSWVKITYTDVCTFNANLQT
jgi:hypothetical protein